MAGNDLGLGIVQILDRFARNELMARSVETEAAHTPFGIIGFGERVTERVIGHCLMERRVERGYLRNGKKLSARANASDVRGHMERAEFLVLFADTNDFVVDQNGLFEIFRAVKDAMPDRIDLGKALNDAVLGRGQSGEDEAQRFGVRRHFVFDRNLSVARLMGQERVFHRDAFANAFCENFLGLHLDQLIF